MTAMGENDIFPDPKVAEIYLEINSSTYHLMSDKTSVLNKIQRQLKLALC